MRFLDLGLAALIGASAITGIVAWNPTAGDSAAASLETQSHLRDDLLGLLQSRGIMWIASSTPSAICSFLESSSNASVVYGAAIGGHACPAAPPQGHAAANLTLELIQTRVVLEAWSEGQG